MTLGLLVVLIVIALIIIGCCRLVGLPGADENMVTLADGGRVRLQRRADGSQPVFFGDGGGCGDGGGGGGGCG